MERERRRASIRRVREYERWLARGSRLCDIPEIPSDADYGVARSGGEGASRFVWRAGLMMAGVPYELRGNKVVKSSTGEVVKDHGSDHARAVRHLRALKANVEEAGPAALGALLERDFSAERRRTLAKSGAAMSDGSFPIVNGGDLDSAIKLARTPAQRAHVKKRAKAIGQAGKIPDGWG